MSLSRYTGTCTSGVSYYNSSSCLCLSSIQAMLPDEKFGKHHNVQSILYQKYFQFISPVNVFVFIHNI